MGNPFDYPIKYVSSLALSAPRLYRCALLKEDECFTESTLRLVLDPLLDALEQSPLSFAKYRQLISSVQSVEMQFAIIGKTMMDKVHYWLNPKFVNYPARKIAGEFGSYAMTHHVDTVKKFRAYFQETVGDLFTDICDFMTGGLLPDSYFDSDSLFLSLQLVIDKNLKLLSSETPKLKSVVWIVVLLELWSIENLNQPFVDEFSFQDVFLLHNASCVWGT